MDWVALARARIPEIGEVGEIGEIGEPVWQELAALVVRAIRAGDAPDLVSRAFALFDAMADADDEAVDNLLVTRVFEVIADHPACRQVARDRLGERGLELLRITTAFWR